MHRATIALTLKRGYWNWSKIAEEIGCHTKKKINIDTVEHTTSIFFVVDRNAFIPITWYRTQGFPTTLCRKKKQHVKEWICVTLFVDFADPNNNATEELYQLESVGLVTYREWNRIEVAPDQLGERRDDKARVCGCHGVPRCAWQILNSKN